MKNLFLSFSAIAIAIVLVFSSCSKDSNTVTNTNAVYDTVNTVTTDSLVIIPPAVGDEFEENGIKYKVKDNFTLEITSINLTTFGLTTPGPLNIPEKSNGGVKTITIKADGSTVEGSLGMSVTSIKDAASLTSKSKIVSTSMPSIVSIGTNVFSNCSNLTEVNMPLATTIAANTFEGCGILTTVKMPVVEEIGANVFLDCDALEFVTMPATTCDFNTTPGSESFAPACPFVTGVNSGTPWFNTAGEVVTPLAPTTPTK